MTLHVKEFCICKIYITSEYLNYEILIIGGEQNRFGGDLTAFNMRKLNFDESVKRAWITKRRIS